VVLVGEGHIRKHVGKRRLEERRRQRAKVDVTVKPTPNSLVDRLGPISARDQDSCEIL
jgi:hypothetical protein